MRRSVGSEGGWVWSTAFAKWATSTIDAPRINLTSAKTLIGALVLLWLHPKRLLLAGEQPALAACKTLAIKRACSCWSTVQFANGPKRSMGHVLGAKKNFF